LPNKSKQKGSREERAIVDFWRQQGVPCERVPLSGSAGGSFTGDVRLSTISLGEITLEAKSRADGFKSLYKWLGSVDVLSVRSDRQQRLYVIPEELLARLIREAESISG